ncbi:hypothetical protein BS17DRAFT_153036 [Gyrodon lividus]|nr:hypothetical protein BS17DRAFT_153036 [Gyrodon lividus]
MVENPRTGLEERDPHCVAEGSGWHVPLDSMSNRHARQMHICRRDSTRLKSLPIGLDETYEKILHLIDGKQLEGTLIRRALLWLAAALRLLHLPDIMEALKIDLQKRALNDDIGFTNETVLLDACRSLVMHNAETGVVTLSHLSVKEYLTGELIRTKLPWYYIGWQDAHEQLARLCMCYMSLDLGHSWKSIIKEVHRPVARLDLRHTLTTHHPLTNPSRLDHYLTHC